MYEIKQIVIPKWGKTENWRHSIYTVYFFSLFFFLLYFANLCNLTKNQYKATTLLAGFSNRLL